MTTQVQSAPARVGHGDLPVHIEGRHEGVALCGTKISHPASPGRPKCVVCLDFTRRSWHVR